MKCACAITCKGVTKQLVSSSCFRGMENSHVYHTSNAGISVICVKKSRCNLMRPAKVCTWVVLVAVWPPFSTLALIGVAQLILISSALCRGTSCATIEQAPLLSQRVLYTERHYSQRPSQRYWRPWRRARLHPTQWDRATGCPTSSKCCRVGRRHPWTCFPSTFTCAMCNGAWTIWISGMLSPCARRPAWQICWGGS